MFSVNRLGMPNACRLDVYLDRGHQSFAELCTRPEDGPETVNRKATSHSAEGVPHKDSGLLQ